jgi:hypothetical protein
MHLLCALDCMLPARRPGHIEKHVAVALIAKAEAAGTPTFVMVKVLCLLLFAAAGWVLGSCAASQAPVLHQLYSFQ